MSLWPAPSPPRNLVELLRFRALEQADRTAYEWLQGDELAPLGQTYAEVDRQARRIAGLLRSTGTVGQRALLLFPPGLDFIHAFIGCLYAGTIAVPTPLPGANRRSAESVGRIAADAGATLALTTRRVLETRKRRLDAIPGPEALSWISTDDPDPGAGDDWVEPAVDRDDLAYLQYTSGSTADPKGVMITHANVLHNLAFQVAGHGYSDSTKLLSWLPHFHDFGLLLLLQPFFAGRPIVLFSTAAFAQRPLRWLKAITDHRVTHSSAPNFAYDLCVSQTSPGDRVGLDLGTWCCAINGAEPIRPETLERFAEAFAPHGFRREAFCPAYGLAEATLKVSSIRTEQAPRIETFRADELERHRAVIDDRGENARALVSTGTPHLDCHVVIAQGDEHRRCTTGEVGEIWVRSPSVARGYWNRPEETQRTFAARLRDNDQGPFLRTGDLGFLHDGHLFVTGRVKDLIIVRGVNHYPQDIELTAETAHEALRSGHSAAFSVEIEGVERLVLVCEQERQHKDTNIDQIFVAANRAVAQNHELEIYALVLVRTGTLPRTTSGKIRRQACRQAFLAEELQVVVQRILPGRARADRRIAPPRDGIEHRLVEIWQETLNVRPIGIHDRFLDLGGSSLLALQLAGRLQDVFGKDLGIADLASIHTIEQLAAVLRGETGPAAWISLVPLRASGSKPPFFCVHPAGGTVMCFDGLTRHMDPQRPLYALQSRGIDGRHATLCSIESMAKQYIAEIRSVQPRGPYHLGGLCLGGIVALEMAVQLCREGHQVGLLAVLDTRRPPGFRRRIRIKDLLRSWLGSSGSEDQRRDLMRVWRDNLRARNRYTGSPFPGRISLFRSESPTPARGAGLKDWERFAAEGLEVVDVPGSHQALLQEPHVRTVAARLSDCLDRAAAEELQRSPAPE